MIVVLLADLSHEWAQRVRRALREQTVVLEGSGPEPTLELLRSLAADVVVTQMLSISAGRLAEHEQMADCAGDAVFLCIAPDEVIERVRAEQLGAPDLWLRASDSLADWEEIIANATRQATLRADRREPGSGAQGGGAEDVNPPLPTSEQPSSATMEVFHRLMAGFAGGFDLHKLLEAYADAVTHFVHCATFCLLWRDSGSPEQAADGTPDPAHYVVYAHRGLRREVQRAGRLFPTDALPTWYQRNHRVITAAELANWSDRAAASRIRRELELFCGQLAVPVTVRGRAAGILILGEKVLGDSYTAGEIETLFAVSNYVGLAAESAELHQELRRAKAYTDRIVHTMRAGLITLGPDERIRVCNPYAAEVLGLDQQEVQGADLRCLPSPLGDRLYAALRAPGASQIPPEVSAPEEVTIRGGALSLRVSTCALLDAAGTVVGSVMLLDDITAEVELAKQRSTSERLDVLTRIVGRIAHEVKNPLTAVKTYAELLDTRGPDRELEQFWGRTVRPEIDHLDDLISNLVRMVEQPTPNPQAVRLEDLVSQAALQLEATQGAEPGSFEVEVTGSLPEVRVDPKPTRDALRYLLDYVSGPARSPVHIQVGPTDREAGQVSVTMRGLNRYSGNLEMDTVFDPLYVIAHPEADLGPVIGERIIAGQDGAVEAVCDNGHVVMRVVLPAMEPQWAAPDAEVT